MKSDFECMSLPVDQKGIAEIFLAGKQMLFHRVISTPVDQKGIEEIFRGGKQMLLHQVKIVKG